MPPFIFSVKAVAFITVHGIPNHDGIPSIIERVAASYTFMIEADGNARTVGVVHESFVQSDDLILGLLSAAQTSILSSSDLHVSLQNTGAAV